MSVSPTSRPTLPVRTPVRLDQGEAPGLARVQFRTNCASLKALDPVPQGARNWLR